MTSTSKLLSAIESIDAANREDPNQLDGMPLAFWQGVLADAYVGRLESLPSDALRLAARAHHLRRWIVPRSSYPDGRSGYLRWRRDQKVRHASDLRAIISEAGMGPSVADRASAIITKTHLGSDPEVQTFEDAVALTFLETQLGSMAERLADDNKMVDIIAKTLIKMSAAGRELAATIDLPPRLAVLVAAATNS